MTRRFLTLLLLVVLAAACGCVPTTAAEPTAEAPAWWIHGIAVTETGAPVGGGTAELWRISGNEWALLASRVSASQAWGFEARQMAARYRVVYVAPAGWRCVSVRSAGVGWQYPGGCVGQIALPEQAPSLGPDLVFVLAPEVTAIPTATRTPMTGTPTPQGTAVWPTDEPTRTPTAITPTATAPAEGWTRWQNPPQEVAAALMYEVEWYLDTLGPSRDPLQLAVMAEYGPALPLGGPMLTHYSVAGPNGTEVATAVRWQVWACARGWVVAWSLETEPYRVALTKGGW